MPAMPIFQHAIENIQLLSSFRGAAALGFAVIENLFNRIYKNTLFQYKLLILLKKIAYVKALVVL